MTGQRIKIGSGTLYTLLEQFLEAGHDLRDQGGGQAPQLCADPKGQADAAKESASVWSGSSRTTGGFSKRGRTGHEGYEAAA